MANFFKGISIIIWSIFCFYVSRLVLYKYWAFDIITKDSWLGLGEAWNSGMTFPWMFVLTFITIPIVWILGLVIIRKIKFLSVMKKIVTAPIQQNKRNKMQKMATKSIKVKKNKSYTEIRPPALKPVMGEAFTSSPRKNLDLANQRMENGPEEDDDDVYQDRDDRRADNMEEFERNLQIPRLEADDIGEIGEDRQSFDNHGQAFGEDVSQANIADVLEDAGYKVLTGINAGDDKIDYIAISNDAVVLCFEETKAGDWLADEERFNDEEPLWFSESVQRVSPAYRAVSIKERISDAITDELPEIAVVPVLIISKGTIINAADMLDTWENMQVFVGRIGEGGPTDLKKLSSLIPKNQDESVDEEIAIKIENILKSLK